MRIYIGSYDSGISVFDLGGPGGARTAHKAAAPSFLAAHPTLSVVYAVREVADGAVEAYRIGVDGGLTPLGEARPSGGAEPCHLAVSPDGRDLIVANYRSGSVAVLPLAEDGALGEATGRVAHTGGGPDPERQDGPHCHQVTVQTTIDSLEVTVVDLGTDGLHRYRLGADGQLRSDGCTNSYRGAGPRHLVVHPSGRRYVAEELSSTVSTYEPVPGREEWRLIGRRTATLTEPAERNYPSELALSPDGRRLYVANRGNDTITTFDITEDELAPVDEVPTGGVWPRHFALIGEALYVANQRSDAVTVLPLDEGGRPAAGVVVAEVATPTCVLPLE